MQMSAEYYILFLFPLEHFNEMQMIIKEPCKSRRWNKKDNFKNMQYEEKRDDLGYRCVTRVTVGDLAKRWPNQII